MRWKYGATAARLAVIEVLLEASLDQIQSLAQPDDTYAIEGNVATALELVRQDLAEGGA